jgi:hypothetical protein
VPSSRSLKVHHRQVDELTAFITAERSPKAAMLIGGDFNVKNAPDRYEHDRPVRSFTVVSEFCTLASAPCEGQAVDSQPWLKSQDLQGFYSPETIRLRPIRISALFASRETGGRLSDHDGYLVRYQFGWSLAQGAPGPQFAAPERQAPGTIRVAAASTTSR